MYLMKLHIKNFRCIGKIDLEFNAGLNVIIGSNNSGKTSILDSLRLALGIGNFSRSIFVSNEDFFVDRFGKKSQIIEIDLTFSGLSEEDKGIFIELLKVNQDGTYELQLHVRYKRESRNGIDKIRTKYWGGEKEENPISIEVMELFYFVYLEALRDAENYLKPNRGNKLGQLFLRLVPDEKIQEEHANQIHNSISSNSHWNQLIEDATSKINEHLENTTLENNNLSVDINFVLQDFGKIAERLKIYIPALNKIKREMIKDILEEEGYEKYFENPQSRELILKKNMKKLLKDESNEELKNKISRLEKFIQKFEIYQNGLGYNNLIYIATVLGDLIERKNKRSENYLSLMIEEPEAHLHPQLQNVLFNYFKKIEQKGIQVFITSHSPTITAKTDMDTVIVMNNSYEVDQLSLKKIEFDDKKHKNYLKRFMDVTKSQLFFANGVIFVEGISEAILLQIFSNILKVDLEKNGIEIVNVGGVAFEPFAKLFNSTHEDKRMKIRGAILSDDDNSNGIISDRAKKLKGVESENLKVFLAKRTFEYELFLLNEELLIKSYKQLHKKYNPPETTKANAIDLLTKLKSNEDKGEFSQLLAMELIESDDAKKSFRVPKYIEKCIKWVVGIEN
jgi:putative ATP-dependent endonuclease of the OLD family